MGFNVKPSGQACGARIEGLDLSQRLAADTVKALRAAWLEHHVLAFPDQHLTDDDLERFSGYFGPFGEDPFIAPIAGRKHVIAVERRAQEQAPLFAEAWHSDWSFQASPPIGTCLYGISIPPVGGDTLFANQHKALDTLPAALRQRIEGLMALHSAKAGYAPDGLYGDADAASDRSMDIRPSADAQAVQSHSLIRRHSETGRASLYSCLGYIVGIEGMEDDKALELLMELYSWQTREENLYTHAWEEGMLIMWDNRCLLHRATGGYAGHDRLLHRTTIGAG
ncbi:MAG: TauD/TfdA family dioxygenase [Congregibacter sp.]|nr:TauD/TfdA family dioxygenase [Congregibacter sp.]